jgi:energy-converting hydrogenase Eha subunit F
VKRPEGGFLNGGMFPQENPTGRMQQYPEFNSLFGMSIINWMTMIGTKQLQMATTEHGTSDMQKQSDNQRQWKQEMYSPVRASRPTKI